MDIRNYFGSSSKKTSETKSKNGKSTKRGRKIIDSDDEDPIPTKIRKKPSKLAQLDSDSDSDSNNFINHGKEKSRTSSAKKTPTKSKTSEKRTPTKSKTSVKKTPPKSQTSEKTTTPKSASVASFFGSSPVKQSSSKLKPTSVGDFFDSSPVNQKQVKSSKRKEVHNDEDFNKTLSQADETNHNIKKESDQKPCGSLNESKKLKKASLNEKESVKKSSTPFKSEKLSSKLASKVKMSNEINHNGNSNSEVKTEPSSAKKTSTVPNKSHPKSEVKTEPSSAKKTSTEQNKNQSKSEVKKEPGPAKKASTELTEKASNDSTSEPEKKKRNFLNYQRYLSREGPKAHGSKTIPQGAENCLEGYTFVITGILESLDRDEAKSLVERYGGKVTTNVSKNTSYLLAGDDAGPSKLEKAEKLGTKKIDEDELLELIRTLPGKRSKYEIQASEKAGKSKKGKKRNSSIEEDTEELAKPETSLKSRNDSVTSELKSASASSKASDLKTSSSESAMWVDKYRPTAMNKIIGQQGDKSNANKLLYWLNNWHKNQTGLDKKKINFAMKFKDLSGASYKAALLSGSPGVGKTTTAQLVCKSAGYSYIEMNASDTRSKKSLEEHVANLVSNTSMTKYFAGTEATHSKHALIMDEVDGMAGNEDRGGVQELIQLIKSSRIPVICICNDKSLPKMRSLLNYCFDLAFQRPRVQQIMGAIMSVVYKEGIKITPPALQEIIVGANQDVRQVLHHLSMWSAKEKDISYDQAKLEAKKAQKHIHMGPFDVLRKVFSGGNDIKSLSDKCDLFFHDYSISPLFVQENYLQVNPRKASNNVQLHLKLLSAAADSLCNGDLIEKQIRNKNDWSLLPVQAVYSSVLPGEYLSGHLATMINFPSWLGKNSSRNKMDRLAQELQQHTRLQISANKTELLLDYCRTLKNSLVNPLVERQTDGVADAVNVMEAYSLSREDLDSLIEVTNWSKSQNPFASLNPKVKAAFTRTYNKEVVKKPYAVTVAAKKVKAPNLNELEDELNGEVSENEEDDSVTGDAMIKMKTTNKASSSKPPAKSKNSTKKKSKGKT